jgi:phosphoribosylamine--glycine ligase
MSDEEAQEALTSMMEDEKFGAAGAEVVIEEFMVGPEVSIHVMADGQSYKMFPESQDNKAAFDGAKGPNTGGMGTISPLSDMTPTLMQRIEDEIVAPIIKALADEGSPYTGLLYPGIMVTEDGPKVVEFNCRFGDPEVQVYMARLRSDLLDYEKGKEITGIEEAAKQDNVTVFQAGTKSDGNKVLTNGGRVLSVTATGDNLEQARKRAYSAADMIDFEGKQYRTDIGLAHDNSKLKEH